jgi:hypothetical protein
MWISFSIHLAIMQTSTLTLAGGMRSKRPSLRLHQGAKRILLHLDRSAPWFCLTWTLKTLDMIILCYDSMIILCLYFLFNYILIYLIILIYIYLNSMSVPSRCFFSTQAPPPLRLWGSWTECLPTHNGYCPSDCPTAARWCPFPCWADRRVFIWFSNNRFGEYMKYMFFLKTHFWYFHKKSLLVVIYWYLLILIPVVPHKAVAEVAKKREPIGEVGCCESRMAERIHWLTERWLELCCWNGCNVCSGHLTHNCWM